MDLSDITFKSSFVEDSFLWEILHISNFLTFNVFYYRWTNLRIMSTMSPIDFGSQILGSYAIACSISSMISCKWPIFVLTLPRWEIGSTIGSAMWQKATSVISCHPTASAGIRIWFWQMRCILRAYGPNASIPRIPSAISSTLPAHKTLLSPLCVRKETLIMVKNAIYFILICLYL